MGSHSLDSYKGGSSRSSLQPQGETTTMRWDWSRLYSCLTNSNSAGSRSGGMPCTSPVLLQPHNADLAQEPCDQNSRKAQGSQFGQVSYSFIASIFSVGRTLQKSVFLPPPSRRNRIYSLCKPWSTKSTKLSDFFPETKWYILPISTQYHLCCPRVANYCVLITKGLVRILLIWKE